MKIRDLYILINVKQFSLIDCSTTDLFKSENIMTIIIKTIYIT